MHKRIGLYLLLGGLGSLIGTALRLGILAGFFYRAERAMLSSTELGLWNILTWTPVALAVLIIIAGLVIMRRGRD